MREVHKLVTLLFPLSENQDCLHRNFIEVTRFTVSLDGVQILVRDEGGLVDFGNDCATVNLYRE